MQHLAEDDARSVDRDPRRQAALYQEKPGREQARAPIEAFADEFVSRVHLPFVVQRDEYEADHQHRQRQSEVELDKTHAIEKALARRAEEGDRTGLSGHHTKAHRPPTVVATAFQEAVAGGILACAPNAVAHDEAEGAEEDEPVQPMHRSDDQMIRK